MTIPMLVMVISAALWLVITVAENPSRGLAWLGEAARLVFFAAVLVVLMGVAGKLLF